MATRPCPTACRTLPVPAADAFALLTDLRHHERWIPLTRMRGRPAAMAPRPPRVGDRWSALSAGVLTDRMSVTRVELLGPGGGEVRYRKHGPLLVGEVALAVVPHGPEASTARWSYAAALAGAPWTQGVVSRLCALMASYALHRVARECAAHSGTQTPPTASEATSVA